MKLRSCVNPPDSGPRQARRNLLDVRHDARWGARRSALNQLLVMCLWKSAIETNKISETVIFNIL
jgi:hypothetical protein